MKVPFLDLKSQYNAIQDEINQALQSVLEKNAFSGGPFVSDFEEEFAGYVNTRYAIGLGSGTEALWAVLYALGIGKGDEVITAANTFIATAEAITMTGSRPVFVDVDEKTYNINPALIERALTGKTKAIIPVHLFGQPADMDPIIEIANKHNLYVIEDACQAHGAEYKGRKAGSMGLAGCFSFYPGKNLGAYGEAGAVVTNDKTLAEKIKMFRNHGQEKKYYHSTIGWNARMDGFQAAVLSVKLKKLARWNDQRKTNARLYNSLLDGREGITPPYAADFAEHVFHIYAIRVKRRDRLQAKLAEKDIWCGIHYPLPLHLQSAYQPLGYKAGDFPVAEECCSEFLSLPMFPELTSEQIHKVTQEIKIFLKPST